MIVVIIDFYTDGPVHRSYHPTAPNAYEGAFLMPNSQPTSSQNGYFSPQTAFYPPTSQPQMPGMDFFQNNPLLNVGLNAVGKSMADMTGITPNMLPNQVKKINQTFVFLIYII